MKTIREGIAFPGCLPDLAGELRLYRHPACPALIAPLSLRRPALKKSSKKFVL